LKVFFVPCKQRRPAAARGEHDMGVYDVGGSGLGQQTSNLMGVFRKEAGNVAAAQEPPELDRPSAAD
jgi:hypothetical protein